MRADAWRSFTSTVGLVAARCPSGVNVMAAEWTYFVNRDPLWVAVTLHQSSYTGDLIAASGEFSVTLCGEAQAAVAQFVGSFSGRDVDKSLADALDWRSPVAGNVSWLTGGVLAAECAVRQVVELPTYRMFIGKALAIHQDRDDRNRPLVKHGSMFRLGPQARVDGLMAVCQVIAPEPLVLRLAGTGAGTGETLRWKAELMLADGTVRNLGSLVPNAYGDLLTDISVPGIATSDIEGARLRLERGRGCVGWAQVQAPAA